MADASLLATLYASHAIRDFAFVTRVLETNHCRDRYFPLPSKGSLPPSGSTRIGVIWHLPAVAARFGLDLAELLATAGAPADVFDHPDNPIAYRTFGRLLALCEQRSGCDSHRGRGPGRWW